MASPLKVVLDTNILISALTHPGRARRFILKLIIKNITIVTSDYIIGEIEEVLKRNKFKDKDILAGLWNLFSQITNFIKVNFRPSKTPLRDPKDHPILITAQKSVANYIITGDKDLLTLRAWKNTHILTMREFELLLEN